MAIPEVAVDDVAAAQEASNTTVIDVRDHDEYADGHIPGARHIPLDQLDDRLTEVPLDERVYVVCQSGRRSIRAAELLLQHDIDAVSVTGGTNGWRESGRSLATGGEITPERQHSTD